jgi:hypothetical protein
VRDDLFHAQASVDWAASHFLDMNRRFEAWLSVNVHIAVEEQPPAATHDPIVAIEREVFPLAFNVEVGAYINAIRSSLDILATSLAYRHGLPNPDKMYFPVVKSEAAFNCGNYNGSTFVRNLPLTERGIIEGLKPYQKGNEHLWALHQLDIMRKHRRLIDVEVRPLRFSMMGWGPLSEDFTPIATGSMRVGEKAVLGLIRKGAPKYNFEYKPLVAFNETGLVARKPVLATLIRFADLASGIIRQFDR